MIRGQSNNGSFKKNSIPWNLGVPMTEKTKRKISESRKGKMLLASNHKWKGEEASYFAKHIWMKTNYGKAQTCENCGVTRDKKMIHWANISNTHQRKRSDWKSLCVSCHSRFDRDRKLQTKIKN